MNDTLSGIAVIVAVVVLPAVLLIRGYKDLKKKYEEGNAQLKRVNFQVSGISTGIFLLVLAVLTLFDPITLVTIPVLAAAFFVAVHIGTWGILHLISLHPRWQAQFGKPSSVQLVASAFVVISYVSAVSFAAITVVRK